MAKSTVKTPRGYSKHGLYAMKQSIKTLGNRTVDQRTAVGKALAEWRADLLHDLGGETSVSTQEMALVHEAVTTKLILDSINTWLLSQHSLINKRTRAVIAVVRDRNTLVTTLRGLLGDLGLSRRSKTVTDLTTYVETKAS